MSPPRWSIPINSGTAFCSKRGNAQEDLAGRIEDHPAVGAQLITADSLGALNRVSVLSFESGGH